MPRSTNSKKAADTNMANNNLSIFVSESSENPVTLLKQSLSLSKENGVVNLSFVLNKGKGSGTQIMPVSELAPVLSILRDAVDNGVSEREEQDDVPAHQVLRQTIHVEDGHVIFRLRNGKGAKPVRIPVSDLESVVSLLEGAQTQIEAAARKL